MAVTGKGEELMFPSDGGPVPPGGIRGDSADHQIELSLLERRDKHFLAAEPPFDLRVVLARELLNEFGERPFRLLAVLFDELGVQRGTGAQHVPFNTFERSIRVSRHRKFYAPSEGHSDYQGTSSERDCPRTSLGFSILQHHALSV